MEWSWHEVKKQIRKTFTMFNWTLYTVLFISLCASNCVMLPWNKYIYIFLTLSRNEPGRNVFLLSIFLYSVSLKNERKDWKGTFLLFCLLSLWHLAEEEHLFVVSVLWLYECNKTKNTHKKKWNEEEKKIPPENKREFETTRSER